MKKLLAIFDMSNMAYRAFYVQKQPDLTYAPNRHDLVRQIVVDCFSLVKILQPTNAFFCFDGSNNFRKLVDSNYKGDRSGTPGMNEVLKDLYDLLNFKKFNAILIENLEADDCIALLCEKYETSYKFIITGDGDIKQLIRPRTYVMPPVNSKRTVFCDENSHPLVSKEFALWPAEVVNADYVLFEKILKGCSTDNVPGLGPVGLRKTKISQAVAEYQSYLEQGQEEFHALYNSIAWITHSPVVEVNKQLQLVCLQSTYMPATAVEEFLQLEFNPFQNFDVSSVLRNTIYFK